MNKAVTWKIKLSILAGGLLSFIGILIETSLNVTFPTLMSEFHVNLATIQWVTTGYLLLVTIVMSTTSYLVKRFDAQKLFLVAVTLCLLGTLVCALATNFELLMLGRLLEALATGISTPTLFHLISSQIPSSKLGVYTGFATMVTSFAPALGPTYGGVINHYTSWRLIFWLMVPVIIAVMILGSCTIKLAAQHNNSRFDWWGLLVLSTMMLTLVSSIDQAGHYGFVSVPFAVGILLTVCLLVLFVYHLRHGQRMLLNFNILRQPAVCLRALNFFILQFINIAVSFVIPILSEQTLQTNSMTAGLILLPGSILGAVVAPFAGNLYDRHGAFLPLMISNLSICLGALALMLLTPYLTTSLIMFFYCFLRGGFNFGYGNTMSDATKLVDDEQKPDVNSLFNTLQQYAGSLGTGIMSAVIAALQLSQPHTPSFLAQTARQGSQIDFGILLVGALVALATTLCVQRLTQQFHNKDI